MKLCFLRCQAASKAALGLLTIVCLFAAAAARAQVTTGSITGSVKDATGAVVPNATVTLQQAETGATRTAITDAAGNYTVSALPIGHYAVSAEAAGFKKEVHSGIALAVGQTAVINLALEVGTVQQEVTVTGEAPVVNTTTAPTSGEVAPEAVKDLPLNGRSYDDLILLTTGTSNFSENDNRSSFSVQGHRGEYNRFLVNGVDLIGQDSSSQQALPIGSSGSLLGVEAVQEFNVETNNYGAELGKRAGGQINIVTSAGTNSFHGDLFEFLRNTDANANSFFFTPASTTTQNRNQFGGAIGGPILKDKVFFFATYEGERQSQRTGSSSTIPDANAQDGLLPNDTPITGVSAGMLPIVQSAWVNPSTYPGGCTEIAVTAGNPGECTLIGAPLNTQREDFGLTRFDYNISSKDMLATTFLYDNGLTGSGSILPIAATEAPLTMELLSLQQTHIFSPELLNVATFGFSRGGAGSIAVPYLNSPLTPAPIPSYDYFVADSPEHQPGNITVSGLASGLGSSTGTDFGARNYFSWADDVHYTKGSHDLSFGLWLQREQTNNFANGKYTPGGAVFSSITTLLQGAATNVYGLPAPTELGFRQTEYAGYLQDNIKLRHNLNVRIGLRIEGDNGWNETHGLSDNYLFGPDSILNTEPVIGVSPFIQNKSAFLPEPRLGMAWDPFGTGKTSVRAGFGIYDDLQEPVNNRMGTNSPENERITYTNVPFLSVVPITAAALPPLCTATIVSQTSTTCTIPQFGGVDDVAQTPTTIQWNFAIEQQLTKNLVVHVEYDGFEAYHTEITADPNEPFSAVCNNPAGCMSGGVNTGKAGTPTGTVSEGTTYLPLAVLPGTTTADGCRPNCDISDGDMLFFMGTSSYNALNAFLEQRFSNGIAFRVNYAWEKVLGYGSGLLGSENSNAPMDLMDFWNMSYDHGPVAYNVPQQLTFNFNAALPFGKGRPWASSLSPVADAFIGGWQVNGIFTVQSGFPFTPLLSTSGIDWDGSGSSYPADVPNVTPGCSVINPGTTIAHYYTDACFSVPLPGTYGDESVGEYQAPGIINVDASLFKKFTIRESKSLELRVEAFNLLNHPNFGIPNQTAFATTSSNINTLVPSATYGQISGLNGNMRQLQFGLKFIF